MDKTIRTVFITIVTKSHDPSSRIEGPGFDARKKLVSAGFWYECLRRFGGLGNALRRRSQAVNLNPKPGRRENPKPKRQPCNSEALTP